MGLVPIEARQDGNRPTGYVSCFGRDACAVSSRFPLLAVPTLPEKPQMSALRRVVSLVSLILSCGLARGRCFRRRASAGLQAG